MHRTGPAPGDDGERRDTVYTLGEVVVTAARTSGPLLDVPMAVSIIEQRALHRGRGTGLDEALSVVPGVFAQSRSGSQDVRLSIRGFGARGAGQRSNSGTSRGVRVMIDGFPETEPDGRTSFDLVDLSLAESIEVLRSNASTLWGNASGGVISVRTVPAPETPPLSLSTTAGGFGFRKIAGRAWGRAGEGVVYGAVSHMKTDGWRVHTRSERTILNTGLVTSAGTHTRLGVYLAAGFSSFRIPGPLSAPEFAADPFQAQGDPAAYSPTFIQRDERRVNRLGRLGVSVTHTPGGTSEILATVFVTPKLLQRSERNTYREFTRYHAGGSLAYRRTVPLAPSSSLILHTGVDGALQDGAVLFYTLINGGRGTLLTDKREGAANAGLFLHSELTLADRFTVLTGIRYDAVMYRSDELFSPDPSAIPLSDSRTFSRWTPKAGIAWRFSPAHTMYLNVGGGLEVPAGNETGPPSTGGEDTVYALNPLLDASSSTTIELGTRYTVGFGGPVRALSCDVALYWIDVRNDFIPYRGGRFYFSAGQTRRAGVEGGLSAELAGGFSLRGAVSFSDNSYGSYTVDSVHYGRAGRTADLAGNRMAGVPPLFYSGQIAWRSGGTVTLFAEASVVGAGSYFADDANRITVPPYSVWSVRAGFELFPARAGGLTLTVSALLENVGDRRYPASAWINPDRNARGEPVFLEPGSPRAFYLQFGAGWFF